MLKLGFNLLTNKEALWVRVLRAKYNITEECLLTNVERCKRGASTDPSCAICRRAEESCIQFLRDYCQAQEVWKQIIPSSLLAQFFSFSLQDWILANLRNVFGLEYHDVTWQSLFDIICWKLWKQMNLTIFQEDSFDFAKIIQSSWFWASYIKSRTGKPSGPMSKRSGNCRWSPPSTGSYKINVDGAHNLSSGLASSTAVAKYEHGSWLWGIGRNNGRCSVEQANL
ncbi:hypothetical protein Gohar_020190 [Gossypium harknessii]|uniref:Reverse transcriptase zinc-binding domain-containing protein n=1 Tax=Gossypium harknessii TaxID=34285 RepID=A0A7J9HWX8_9ROSI|nr:hypothetical protein [Gossypium harknessii]